MTKRTTAAALGIVSAGLALALAATSCSKEGEPQPQGDRPCVRLTKSGVPMVALPGGWFVMGSGHPARQVAVPGPGGEKDETPHRVYVSPFDMDQYEVSQEEFEKVLGRNPSRWTDPKAPVEQIRWKDAAEYCNARSRLEGLPPAYDAATWQCDFVSAGYRLPTEAEWEYACRAGTQTEYFFGDSPSALAQVAWFKENCTRRPGAVGGRQPNPWGLYDMYGNVWEWCNDFYGEDYYGQSPEKDPRGPPSGPTRVLRGGCWNSRARQCRSAYRNEEKPGYTDVCFGPDIHGFVGFRCVRRPDAGQ
jgi:formylglycine-generating enzyme required for sulfatase activity